MKSYGIFIVSVFLFVGCSSKMVNNNLQVPTTLKEYKGFSKIEILNAAKKMFRITGKNKFIVDSYRDKIEVTKLKASYNFFGLELFEDKFKLEVKESIDTSKVFLTMKRVIGLDQEEEHYFDSSVHLFLWERINYILGLSNTWPTCIKRYLDFKLTMNNLLCDPVDLDNSKMTKKTVDKKSIDTSNVFNIENNNVSVSNKDIETIIENGIKIKSISLNNTIRIDELDYIPESDIEKSIDNILEDEVKLHSIMDNQDVTQNDINIIINNGNKYVLEEQQKKEKDVIILESELVE